MRSFLVKLMLKRHRGFFEKLEEFEKTQYWSETELQSYQEEKLRRLIKHAYETVPFYKESFDREKLKPVDIKTTEDLAKVPVLNKETLRSNHDKLISRETNKNLRFTKTGGSTGVPLSIANDHNVLIADEALFYRFLGWMGYDFGDKRIEFWGEPVIESLVSRFKKRISRFIYNQVFVSTFSVDDELLARLSLRVKNIPPKLLRGYTSSIYLLALKSLELRLPVKLDAVSTTAEKLFKFQRDKICEAFGENIFDQYGCGETCSIAFECEKHKGLHVASEHVILETLDWKNQRDIRGKVVITNLDNYAMPIIRYENGDEACWSEMKCSCGRNLPLLKKIEGRVSEFIEGANGNKVHGEFFTHIFNGLDIATKYSIKEFRIVQETVNKLRIEFVTDDNLDARDESILRKKINEYLGEMDIEIRNVKEIPLTKRGKKMFVIPLKQ